ncbi:MAG: NAD(P)-binding protein [Rhodospirillales bacterium]|nr:NAD(P)-binding protein [Rhodospirillales bacterium]
MATAKNRADPHVAIVGAGIAGLACGERLARAGGRVSLFDKGRGPGGRCATRRAGAFAFDHGAQYATATDAGFRRVLDAGQTMGAAAPWAALFNEAQPARQRQGDGRERWVGVPSMSALARHLGQGIAVHGGTRVAAVEKDGGRWRLRCDDGSARGPFDIVVVAVPATQAGPLLAEAPALAARVGDAALAPCWALMLAFAAALPTPVAAAFVEEGPLSWICHDGGKPGRAAVATAPAATWVAHASASWSRKHLEEAAADVAPALLAAFAEALGLDLPPPVYLAVHRWRYAKVERALDEPCLYDPDLGIGTCGDWCLGPRLEAAYLSGVAMAERVLAG